MFSLRIVTTNHYQAKPIPGLDTTHSEFRNTPVQRVPVLRIFGSTPAGQKTCMHVHGVFPYLYVPYDGTKPVDRYLRQFAASLDKALNVASRNTNSNFQHVYKISLVSGIPMYGYHPEEKYFLKIYLFNPTSIRRAADLLLGGAVMNKPFQPHESHIPYALQLFIDYNLYGMNLLNAAALKFRKRATDEKCASKGVKKNSPLVEAQDSSLQGVFKVSSPGGLSSSSSSSPVDRVWHENTIPSDLWLPADVERQSTCELEVDVVAADILNRHELASNVGANPGLTALWEDEKQRRRDAGDSSQLEPDSSQERDGVVPSASEKELVARFFNIVKHQQALRSSQSDESFSSQPSYPASQVENHVSQADSIGGSQNTVMVSDSDDGEGGVVETEAEYAPIVNMNSIERVVSCSQSFSHIASQKDMPDSQDRSVADILAALLQESGPPPSQLASLEDQDSILNQSIILDKEGEQEEEEESILMTQFINEDLTGANTTSLVQLDEPWDDDETDNDIVMNTDDSDDEVDLLPQFDGASDKVPDSHVKSDTGPVPSTTSSQSAGMSQGAGVASQNPAADTSGISRTDVSWRAGTAGRAVGSTQGFPSGSGSWTQQGWSQQTGTSSGTWHGQNPSWSHQQNYQNWPQQQMPSATFSSQQAPFHSSSPATTFQSPPHNPYASPTHQQAYQTPSPSASHHQYQYPSYQSPAPNQSYQQPYQSPSQHPYQSPAASQTFHSPQSYHSSSSTAPYQSPSGQPFSPSAAAGQPYQMPASSKSYASSPGSQPYQSPTASQPYQSPQGSSGYQSTSGQLYPSPYQSPSQSHHSSPQQPYPLPYQSPVHGVRYSSQSSWCAQGYPGYYQGLAGSHVTGSSGKHSASTGSTQSLQPDPTFGQTCNSSSSGLNSFPAQDLQQHQQTCAGSLKQIQTEVNILNKLPSSHIVAGPETQSAAPQPSKRKGGRKAKVVAEVCEFKSPQPPCLSPTSVTSKNHFESGPFMSCLQSSSNTPPVASVTGFSHTKLQDYGDSANVNTVDGNKSAIPTRESSETLLTTKISTLEFKPNIVQFSVGPVSTESPTSKCIAPSDQDQSSSLALKGEASTATPMIQQLLMEEPVRMNIRKEDREAVMKKPTPNSTPKPRKKYTRRTDQGVRKPGRPRSTSLSAPAHLPVGYCGYPQPVMNLPTACRQDKSHTASISFNGESSMPSPMQSYAWQQHWKQQNFQVGSQWQQQQQPQQQQWAMNDWQSYNSLGEGGASGELDINSMPATSRVHQRSLSADTIHSPIFEHSAHPGQLPPFSADHLSMQDNSASIEPPDVHRDSINDKSSLSSLFQLVSDVGSEDIDWENTSSAVVPNLFPNSSESETPKSTPSSDVNQGSPLVKDFITLEAPCKQVFDMTEKANSDTTGMTSSEESDRTDLDFSSDLQPRTLSRSHSLGSSHPRLGKQSRLKKLGLHRSTDLGCVSGPVESNPSYTYTFHVPTPVFKKLKFFRSAESRKHNINVVRMHPMDARRYSLLKIGREIVKAVKLTEVDLAKHNVSLPSPYPFVFADGSTNRVNLDIPVVSVDRRSGDSGSEESSLSKFDTDFPPNKVAPPSFFNAGQVSASLTRSSSTAPRGSPVSSDWLRQYTGQQSANYNGRFSPGMQAAYSPQHAGISPQRSNFPFAQQQRDGRVNSFSGHQHMPQNNLNRHFSSQPPEDTSGLAFQQLSHKGNSFYPQSTPASTQLQGNYYTHQQDAYMNQNQTSVTQQQSYYQQQYQQQQYQLQQQFAQQQTQTSLNSSNPEPKNGLRSPGQHGLISKIDSGSVLGHSADQEPECDNNATETSPFNTRVNAQRRDIHAEHMASCAAPQNANVYTTLSPQVVGSTDDNTHSDSHIHLSSQILELEEEHSFGNQMNDSFLQNRIVSSHCPKQFRRLSLRKSEKCNGNPLQVENAFSLNEFPDTNGDQIMANHCPNHETSEHINDIPSVSTHDACSKHLHSNASFIPGRGRQRERTSWQKNVKALSLKMPMPHSDQSNGGINGIHNSLQYSEVHSATSSQKGSDIDDNGIREDFSPSSSSSRLTRLVDNASTPTEKRSPRQAKLRSIYSKNRYNLKPKKKRKRQKRLIEGIHYIVVGKFRGHQVMLVKVKKLHLSPTESVRADLFEELAAKEIVRVVSPERNVEHRVSGKELQAGGYHSCSGDETNSKMEDMQFPLYNNTAFNQHTNSVPQTYHRPSRGRSLRHGRFRSARTLVKNQEVALATPKGNEAESKNVLAGLISGNVHGNSISEARENIRNCCQFMYDNFFLLFKDRFSKRKKAKESISSSKYECLKDNFFENVRSSSFCSFQQKFLANIQKLKSSDYSSSSDDEDDVLDDTVLKAKLGMPYMLLTCARNKFYMFKSVKNGYTRPGQSLFNRKPVVNGKASVMPWWCEDIQPNKLEAIDSIQGKHCRVIQEQSMNRTALHSDEEKTLSPSSEFCLDENSNPQEADEAVSKELLMSETIHVKSGCILKEKSNNLHMPQETDLDKSGFINHSILVNTSLCSDTMKMQEEKDDYLKSQMAFFEDISSDSHSSDTIIMGNFVAGENNSEDEELSLQDCPSATCKSMSSTYVIASSETCVPDLDIVPSTKKDSSCEDTHGASSAALKGQDIEHTELSSNFEDNSDKTSDTVTGNPLHKNIQVCTAEHGQGVLSVMDKSVSQTNASEKHAEQTEASGDGVFLTQASCESVLLMQASDESELLTQASDETVLLTETFGKHVAETLESVPQLSAFVEEDVSLQCKGNDLKLPGTKTGVLYESDDDATIELDMNHDISSKVSSNDVFEQFPLLQAKELAGNKSVDKSIDSDNDLDSSVSVNSSDRPKKHGKGMKKSRRDKGSNLVNRRQLMDDDNSSSNDELNSVTENDTLSHNKHLRQRKQTLYTYYTDICDSSGDSSDSSDEDFNSRASHRKGSKSNRKHKGDTHNRKLHQISSDFGKAARSGHRARPTRGKKKKSSGGDKLLNSLSLLHMATLANLTETQAEGQSVASMAIDNVHSQSLQYSDLATSDHNTTFTPSLDHMSFISPHNSDEFVVSPPVACSPTDKNRWQQTRGGNPRVDEIAVSRRLLNSQRLARLKPGCNGASNLGSKPLPFSRLISNSASPIPSNFSFIHISDSSLRPEPVIQCEDAGTSNNTLQLLETRRAQVNCASFSMKDILRLTTPDDSMDSDSKDSAALIRPPEPKRAQVKSTSLSMSDILKLTSVDKGTDIDNSQSSYSLLSLLANAGPCSDLSSNKTVEMSSQYTSLHGCHQQPAECRSASNSLLHSTSFMNPVAEIHDKLTETSSPPLPLASDVSTPSIPLSGASELSTSVDQSDTQGLKNLQVEFSQLVKDSCSDTEMDSSLTSPCQTLGISACGTEQPALVKCPPLSAASISKTNSHDCGSEVKMKCYEKAKLRRHKKHKRHERKRSKKGIACFHSEVNQTTTGSPVPVTVNVENNLDARLPTERLLPLSPVQPTVTDTSFSENPTHSLLQTQPSPSGEQQVRQGQAGKPGADKVVSANAASSLLLSVRTEDPVADSRELAKSHKSIQAQKFPKTNISGTPVSTVLEIPKISKARDETFVFDRFYGSHPRNLTCREDKTDTDLKIKDLEQMLKPLHPLQIPAYPFITHSFESQLGQSCHHSLNSCLCFPYCWQWPVHTPGSDSAASPLNLCTVEKSPNNYCPVAPVSPMSPNCQSHAQAVTLSGVSPPIKKAKPLWYPWLTVESFANRSDANANIIQQKHNSDVNKAENKVNVFHNFSINTSYLEPSHESATCENTCKAPTVREAQNKKANTSIPSKTLRRSSSKNIDLVARTLLEANKARMNAERLSSCQTVSELLGNVIEAEYEQGSPTVTTSSGSVSIPVLTASSKMSHGVDTKHPLVYRRGVEQKYGVAADLHKKEDAALLGVTSTSELNIKCSRQFSEEIHDKIVKKFCTENTSCSLDTDSYNAAICKPEHHYQQITDNTQACHFGFSSVPRYADNVLTGLGDKLVTKLIQGDLGYLLSEPAEASKGKKLPNSTSSQKRSSTEDKSNEDRKGHLPGKTDTRELPDNRSEIGSGCKDRNPQEVAECENAKDITVCPLKAAPGRGAIEETLLTLGLPCVQPPVAFCTDPEDLPDRPMEHGGRVLKVESKRLSELSPFITSQHIIGIKIWRSHSLSSSKLLASQSQGRPLRDRLEQDPQMQFLLTGEQLMVVSPACTPPIRSSVQKWLQNKMVDTRETKPLDNSPLMSQSHGSCIAVEAITDDKHKQFEHKGSFNTSTENSEQLSVDLCRQIKADEIKRDDSIDETVSSETTMLEVDSSACVDTDLDVSCTPSTTTPVRLVSSLPCSIIPLSTPSFAGSQEPNLTNSRPAARVQRKRSLRFSDDCARDVPEVSSPTESHTLDEHYKKTKRRALEAQTYKQEIPRTSYHSLSSTPVKESMEGPLDIACTPISSPQECAKQSSQDTARIAPGVAQNRAAGPDIPVLRHISTNTESLLSKTILTTQTQRQVSDPGANNVSQIEGPTPRNSFGFKVAQTHMQDSKVLHKYQYVTAFSMELHVETRGDLRPDPEFDAVKALFYSVLNDIPPVKGTRNITGVLVVDLDSWNNISAKKGQEQIPGTASNSSSMPVLSGCAAASAVVPEQLPPGSAFSSTPPPPCVPSQGTSSAQGNLPTKLPNPQTPQPSPSLHFSGKGKGKGRPVPVADNGVTTGDALLEKCAVEGMEVTYVRDEVDLINTITQLITQFDPDILVGFEIQMLSWGYLLQRAAQLNIDLCSKISRVQDAKNDSHFNAEKDEWGADHMSEIHVAGRIVLNLWRVLRHEITLNVYSFENVAYHVLHQRVPLFSFRSLTKWYGQQTHLHRWRVFEHYFRRVRGQLDIIDQLDLIGKTSEFARVFGIEFYDVLARGSQIRVESMMLRLAKPMNFVPVSPGVNQRARQKAAECIPLNLEPESKYYTSPVAVLDFQSLYPSIMIAYNYCFTTCLGRLDSLEKAHEGAFEFGCTSLNLTPAVLKNIRDFVTVSPNGVAFLKSSVRRGVLPIMVEEILNTRLMVKKSMKSYKDDKILSRMLDARQLGLKLIANVTYGYTGASFSGRMPCIEVGDSIVRKARESLERAIELVRSTPRWGGHVVYGDTDSMFIHFPGRSKDEAFVLGQEIADAVTAMFPKPMKLRFEKIYLPCVLQTKKRYVGFMYETQDQTQPVYDAKGIETVRRDACSAVSKVLERSIKVLFSTHDLSRVKHYVTRQLHKLLEGKVSVIDLIFAKEYRGMMGYKPGACIPSLEIARRRLRLDRRSEPRVGERVPYVIVHGSPGLPLIQLVREPSELVTDTSLRLNATYYITKQILPPLDRLFSLIGISVFKWYLDMPKVVRVGPVMGPTVSNKQGTISQFFATNNCPVCDAQTKLPVCDQCLRDPQLVTFMLTTRIRDWERTCCKLTQVCAACQGTQDSEQTCVSIDCPIMFRRIIANSDLVRADNLQETLTKYLQF